MVFWVCAGRDGRMRWRVERLSDICFADGALQLGVSIKGRPLGEILRTSFFRWINHSSTSLRWNIWWQGSTRTLSPLVNSERQIAHSSCVSNHGWLSVGSLVDASSVTVCVFFTGSWSSRSTSAEETPVAAFASSPPSCFSQWVPVHICHGRLRTTSSGARSRWAARAARIRWIRSVMNVSAEGRRRMTMNVMIGLGPKSITAIYWTWKIYRSRIPFPCWIFCRNQQW